MTRFASIRRCALSSYGVFFLFSTLLGCGRAAKPPEEKVPPSPVKWEGPRQLILEEWTELVGTTQPLPDHAARLTAPVGGVVMSVLPIRSATVDLAAAGMAGCAPAAHLAGDSRPIAEGQMVNGGDVLAQLDATVMLAALSKAQAAKKILQAEREVVAFTVKQAALELKRLEELRQQDARVSEQMRLVSPLVLEKAALTLESAQAGMRADDRKLEAADKEEASLDMQLKLYTLTAPRKGRLGRLQVVIGQTLALGAPVAEVVDIEDEIDVLCFVSPAEARKLQLGQIARNGGMDRTANAESTADPEGKVVYIANQAEADTGLFAVKIRFPNVDLKLRASSVVRLRILTTPGKACWAVPESALMEDQDPPGIVVVENVELKKNADGKDEQSGKVRRLRAVTGMRDRVLHQVEILRLEDVEKKWHGELEQTLIVVDKGQSLQTGDTVKLEEEEEEEPMKTEEKS